MDLFILAEYLGWLSIYPDIFSWVGAFCSEDDIMCYCYLFWWGKMCFEKSFLLYRCLNEREFLKNWPYEHCVIKMAAPRIS